MSNGYLLVSETDIDELQKNRYMKFEKLAGQYNFHVYARMEYLNQKHALIDLGLNGSLHLSRYGEEFFRNLKFSNEIYFYYFLLEKHRCLEDVAREACKNIALKTKKRALSLCKENRSEVLLNEIYRISSEVMWHE